MSKHTPGPWFAKGRYIGTKNHMSAIGECRDVNGNWSDDVKASANAILIAAAPDLLEALTLAAQSAGFQYMIAETRAKIEAAIAKAEARQ